MWFAGQSVADLFSLGETGAMSVGRATAALPAGGRPAEDVGGDAGRLGGDSGRQAAARRGPGHREARLGACMLPWASCMCPSVNRGKLAKECLEVGGTVMLHADAGLQDVGGTFEKTKRMLTPFLLVKQNETTFTGTHPHFKAPCKHASMLSLNPGDTSLGLVHAQCPRSHTCIFLCYCKATNSAIMGCYMQSAGPMEE